MTQFSLTVGSKNKKTGGIPTSTSHKGTCPQTCPMWDNCYAKAGPQHIHWSAVSKGERGSDWDAFIKQVKNLPNSQLWRHNVSGDLCHIDGTIDKNALGDLIMANAKKKGFTYTHHLLHSENINLIRIANNAGFTINCSTESVEQADRIMTEHKLPAVAIVKSTETRRSWKTENGRTVQVCPAQLKDSMNCAKCGLCQDANRDYIIAFKAHGIYTKKIDKMLEE